MVAFSRPLLASDEFFDFDDYLSLPCGLDDTVCSAGTSFIAHFHSPDSHIQIFRVFLLQPERSVNSVFVCV